MQAAERAYNFLVDFCLQAFKRLQPSSRCCDVDHRFDLRRPDSCTDVDADEMSNSRRSPSLIPVSVGVDQLAVESHTDLFEASHWLEQSSCRFPVTLLVFSREDHRTSQVLTTFYVVLSQLFIEGWLQKPPSSSDLPLHWSTAVTSHAAVNSDARSIQISSQNIHIYC